MKKVLIVAAIIPILMLSMAMSKGIAWGLTPNTKEMTPGIPRGAQALLDAHNGIFVGDTSKKEVYLTFDLGYEAGHTAGVLDVLKENSIKAIFFLCGNYLKETELVTRMMAEGHIIGNHTDKHKDLPTLSEEAIRKDIDDFTIKFKDAYPDAPPLKHFRPGKGRFDERTLRVANEQNLKTVMWSSAIVDWARTPIPVQPAVDKILSRIHPGAIILFHISNSSMSDIISQLIPMLHEKGYSFGDATIL